MNFIKKILDTYRRGLEYEDLADSLNECESGQKHLLSKVESLQDDVDSLDEENELLYSDLESLQQQKAFNSKHSSLKTYKEWLESNVNERAKYYDFGHGRRRVHTAFKQSLQDEEVIREFISEDLGFDGSDYDTADDLVYAFNVVLGNKFPTSRYYAFDQELYGEREFWASAKQTIQKLRSGGKAFDCDDSMILRYSCLYYLLNDYFPDSLWRLRGFIVDLWTGGGHALLAWVKEGVNDWVVVESTFYDSRIHKIWSNDYVITKQMLYDIRYSFDERTEYEK